MFQRNLSPPSSGISYSLKIEAILSSETSVNKISSQCHILLTDVSEESIASIFRDLLHPEDRGDTFLRNFG
jgi:hypothetical protein